jgi:hypothetical protein
VPLTPYHMGPGLLVKALLRGNFSLIAFGVAQVVMDLQPLVVMLTGQGHLHGWTHTYVAALVLGLVCAPAGKYLGGLALRVLLRSDPTRVRVTWRVALLSALIGSFSHVLIDSLIYKDVAPFAPFSQVNPMAGILGSASSYDLCVWSGLLGLLVYIAVSLRRECSARGVATRRGHSIDGW